MLIAMPSIPRSETQKLIQSLKQYPVIIRTLPSLTDLAQGRVSGSGLKKINIEFLFSSRRRHTS